KLDYKNFIIFSALLLLASCANNIKSNVTRFHQLPPANGQSIEVISIDPALQQSIEFGTYADMIGSQLGSYGYTSATDGKSHYIAEISYSIENARGVIVENSSPISVGVGVGGGSRRGTSVGMGISTSFGSGSRKEEYVNRLHMNIINLATTERVFEGHAENTTNNPNLSQSMPFLINAMFENFPGESGATNTVTVKPN
ncbi:MAG: DUF4136 domain-containing protein, partial [Emcibacteraceae bacterium]|nr:DUF4136 domain-containing protein [Emcibacteraceae bacterium]